MPCTVRREGENMRGSSKRRSWLRPVSVVFCDTVVCAWAKKRIFERRFAMFSRGSLTVRF